MRDGAKKITTAAVCTAIAIVMCVCTAYLPLSVMPLYVAAFCFFLACKRGGTAYGVLSALATTGIMFAMTGLSVKWFFLLIVFAPYGIMANFIHRFTYFKVKSGLLRGVIVTAFFNLTLGAMYLIAANLLTAGLDIPLLDWVNKLGGYWAIALIGTALMLPLDFVFSAMSGIVLKKLPAVRVKKAPPPEADDVFGYEVYNGGEETEGDKKDDNNDDNIDKEAGQ